MPMAGVLGVHLRDQDRGLHTPSQAEFGQQRGDAILHRLLSQEQVLRDLTVRHTLADQLQDAVLVPAENSSRQVNAVEGGRMVSG